MTSLYTRARHTAVPLLAPLAFGLLTACQGSDRALDDQMRADLMAASQAPSGRQQFASPAELGYPQGYAPAPGMQGYAPYPGAYPQPYPGGYPQAVGYPAPYPQPQTRVVYVPQQTTVRRTSSGGAGGSGASGAGTGGADTGVEGRRNTQKGAIYGAATGAAIGVISSRDKAKGAAIGALGGAVLGGLIGHQVRTPQ